MLTLEGRRERARAVATLALRRLLLVVFFVSGVVVLVGSGLNNLGHKYTRVVVKGGSGGEGGGGNGGVDGGVGSRYGASAGSELVMAELETTEERSVGSSSNSTKRSSRRRALAAAASASNSSSSSSSSSGGGVNVTAAAHSLSSSSSISSTTSSSSGGGGSTCKRQVLATNLPGSVMCCDSALRHNDWVCVAAFDRFNKVLSSTWAYVIPLVPWALSAALESSATSAHARRLGVYVFVFALRTFVLYKALGWLQAGLQPRPGSDCWYASYTRGSVCGSDNFDFSDHIVLYVANYLVPAALEAAYAYTSLLTAGGSLPWLRYAPVAAASLLMATLTLRGVLFTCMFFHTPLESIVGLGVVSGAVLVPLYALAGTNFWHNAAVTLLQKEKTATSAA